MGPNMICIFRKGKSHIKTETQGEDERGRHGSDSAASQAKDTRDAVTTRSQEEARKGYPESQSSQEPTGTSSTFKGPCDYTQHSQIIQDDFPIFCLLTCYFSAMPYGMDLSSLTRC